MTALPPSTDFTGAGITEGQFKTAISSLRDYLATLLGTTGAVVDALVAMGVPMSKTQTKTGAYTVIASDRGSVIEATSGTWTLSLTAAATLGDGFVFSFINSGSGTITIDPNASELIAGQATLTMGPGTSGTWYSNGTQWRAVASATLPKWPSRVRVLTSGTSYTPPSDVVSMRVFVSGATGGTAAASTANGGVGGPGYSEKYYATVSGSYSYAIGTAGTSSGTVGGAGGTTSFGVMSVTGSSGVNSATLTGAAGGVGSGGDFNATGASGGSSSYSGVGAGGGSAAGRWGSGSAGGGAVLGSWQGGGGGGGSGGAGSNGGAPAGGAGGIAASTLSASSISGFDSILAGVVFPTGGAGGAGDMSSIGGYGGTGAPSLMSSVGLAIGATSCRANGGNGAGNVVYTTGTPGLITIWEYLS